MKERLLRIWRAVRRGWPFTLLGGALALLASVAVAHYGFGRIDMVFLAAGLVLVFLLAFGLIGSVLGWAIVRWSFGRRGMQTAHFEFECGYPTRTGFLAPRLWYLPFITLSWEWVTPAADVIRRPERGMRWAEEVVPRRRAQRGSIVRCFHVGDVFGLTKVSFEIEEEAKVRALPSVGGLKQMHVVRSLAGGDALSHPDGSPEGERIDLRRYVPGDPIRFILWKVFAKTRELIIRTPERALSSARQTVAYLVAGHGDEAAAGAARVAVDVGALGGEWVFGADGVPGGARSRSEAMEALARSSDTPEQDTGHGLGGFLKESVPAGTGRAVVFVPGRPGPWLDGIRGSAGKFSSLAQSGGAPMEFIVCTDGIDPDPPQSKLGRLLHKAYTAPKGREGAVTRTEVLEVVQALGALRARVLVIDRRDGRIFGPEAYHARSPQ